MISEIIPHAVYNPEDETYDLHLKVKLENNFAVRLGGNISTSNSNQIYLGLSYQDLNYYAKEFLFDGQLGKVYNNAQFMAKIDFSTAIPTSYRFIASITTFDYFKKDKLFSRNDKPAFNQKDERFLKLQVGLPFLLSKRAEFGIGIARMKTNISREISSILRKTDSTEAVMIYSAALSASMEAHLIHGNTRHKATKKLLLHRYSWDGKDSIPVKRPKEFK